MPAQTLGDRSLVLFDMALFFTVSCIIVVTLRTGTRISIRGFGIDDWLMLIGGLLASGLFIVVLLGCKAGLGNRDRDLVAADVPVIKHYLLVIQVLYLLTMAFIKSSICVALIRLTNSKRILYILYGIIAISSCSSFVALVIGLSNCQPMSAAWDGKGKCRKPSVVIDVSNFFTVSSIVTDVACSILPFVILWNLQMKRSLKLSIAFMLSLGLLSSAATIARVPYLSAYRATVDSSWKLQRIILFIILEIGVAIIVGSVPSLKPLVRSVSFFRTDASSNSASFGARRSKPTGAHINISNNSYPLKSVTYVHGEVTGARDSTDDNSLRKILGDGGQDIHVSKKVHVSVEPHESRDGSDRYSE